MIEYQGNTCDSDVTMLQFIGVDMVMYGNYEVDFYNLRKIQIVLSLYMNVLKNVKFNKEDRKTVLAHMCIYNIYKYNNNKLVINTNKMIRKFGMSYETLILENTS